jgi:hypothetical protein
MQIPCDHSYTLHRNKQLLWIDSDSKEEFDANMQDPERRMQLEKYGWDRPEIITYQFNGHGFRCQEFDQSLGVIALGCSFTAGVGLPVDSVWPAIVGAKLNLPVWNLGIGGASMDTCFRLLYHYIHQLNAEYVLLLTPPDQRFELHTPDKVLCFHPQTIYHNIQKWWYQCSSNGQLNYIKNVMAIAELCRQHNRRLIVQTPDNALFGLPHRDRWPPARDMLHVGTQEQKKCANLFLQAIKTDQANHETGHVVCPRPQTD